MDALADVFSAFYDILHCIYCSIIAIFSLQSSCVPLYNVTIYSLWCTEIKLDMAIICRIPYRGHRVDLFSLTWREITLIKKQIMTMILANLHQVEGC